MCVITGNDTNFICACPKLEFMTIALLCIFAVIAGYSRRSTCVCHVSCWCVKYTPAHTTHTGVTLKRLCWTLDALEKCLLKTRIKFSYLSYRTINHICKKSRQGFFRSKFFNKSNQTSIGIIVPFSRKRVFTRKSFPENIGNTSGSFYINFFHTPHLKSIPDLLSARSAITLRSHCLEDISFSGHVPFMFVCS